MKKIFILLFLLPLLSKAQVYQAMPQAGYGPVKRMIFDSVLSIPLGISKVQNITGGRDTGQLRYNKADSSLYTYSGNGWRKVSGGGTTTDTTSLSNRIDNKLSSITATSPITVTEGITPIISTSMATNKLIGRSTASTGVMEQIAIGSGLTLSGGTLTNTATATPLGYYGAFSDTTSQTAAAINTGYPMKFAINDITPNGVTIITNGSGKSRITFANSGIYNLQWSAQFRNTESQEADASVWLRKNGVDIVGSRGLVGVPKKTGTINGHILPSWNFVLDVVAGEYYEFVWSAANTAVSIQPFPATGYAPSTASTILTVSQQSGIMAGTGITAINSLTGAAQTMITGTDSLDFKIVSTGTQHKFNIPNASATKRGLLSIEDWSTFNNKVSKSGDVMSGGLTINEGTIIANSVDDNHAEFGNGKVVISNAGNIITGNPNEDNGNTIGSNFINTTKLNSYTTTNSTAIAGYSDEGIHGQFGGENGFTVTNSGRTLIGTSTDNTIDKLQVDGTIAATNLKNLSGTYSGTVTYTGGTAPTTAIYSTYRWSQTGKLVTLNINITYSVAGGANTIATLTLPTGAPTPSAITGSLNLEAIYFGAGMLLASPIVSAGVTPRVALMRNNNAITPPFDLQVIPPAGTNTKLLSITIQYFTN